MKGDFGKFAAGYQGKDAMREKAKRAMGDELKSDNKTERRESSGRPGFRWGGVLNGGFVKDAGPYTVGSNPKIDNEFRAEKAEMDARNQQRAPLKCGGKPNGRKFEGKQKYDKNGKPKFGVGGALLGMLSGPLLRKIPKVGNVLADVAGVGGGFLPFKKGGRTKRAEGGEMAEPSLITNAKKRWADSHPNGAMYSKGGKARRARRADGGDMDGEEKFAIGGAGKVRKGQATRSGKPVFKKK